MAIPTVLSRAQHGMEAPLVRVEVHLGNGLPRFMIVGLPDSRYFWYLRPRLQS